MMKSEGAPPPGRKMVGCGALSATTNNDGKWGSPSLEEGGVMMEYVVRNNRKGRGDGQSVAGPVGCTRRGEAMAWMYWIAGSDKDILEQAPILSLLLGERKSHHHDSSGPAQTLNDPTFFSPARARCRVPLNLSAGHQ